MKSMGGIIESVRPKSIAAEVQRASLVAGLLVASLALNACGKAANSTPEAAVSSVTVTASPTTIYVGQSSTCTAVVSGTGAYNSSVTWLTNNGAITSAGVLSPTSAGSATCTAESNSTYFTGSTGHSGSATITVLAPTITGVTVVCAPSSITTAQSSICSATITGTGAYSPVVNWSATNGTISASGVFTPGTTGIVNGTETSIITATSMQDSTKSASANVAVTLAAPVATSLNVTTFYSDDPAIIANIQISGSNFLSSDILYTTGCGILSAGLTSSTAILVNLNCVGTQYTTGYIGFYVCHSTANGGACSGTVYFAYMGENRKGLALTNGEAYFLQGATINKYKVNANTLTADGSFSAGVGSPVSVDNTTGYVMVGVAGYDTSGNLQSYPNNGGSTDDGSDVSVKNGTACVTRPSTNYMSCWAVNQKNAPLTSVTVGSEPITIAMASFGTSTRYEYVVSRGGTPTLWLLTNESLTGTVQLTGFSPVNSYPTGGTLGGWPIVVFESGPAQGLVAVLSVPDGLLLILDKGATKVLQSVKLSGTPVNIAKDETNGNVVVGYANVGTTATTTFSAVNALTGATSTRSSTSSQFPVGFLVSADGNYLYVAQPNATTPDVQLNK